MSRIHEALKKAEEERAWAQQNQPLEETPPPKPVEVRERVPLTGAAAVAAAPFDLATLPGTTPLASAPVPSSFEELVTHCPRTEWRPDQEKLLFLNDNSHHTPGLEEFRTLRSRLYQIRQKQRLQTILISSALPGEGKSFVAANLAGVIARQQGRRVLLIDADLRRSNLHVLLGAPLAPGLSEYLRGDATEHAIVQQGPVDNLFLVTGGMHAPNPAELLANGRLKVLLQSLTTAFDWVILDSSPAVPVSDASVIADACDGVLLVLQSAVTPLEMARKARQEFHNKPLLGVVLNRVEPRATYGSYYHYGRQENTAQRKGKIRS